MTFNQLKYFVTICECKSLTRAAELCFISQPAISLSIRDLETEFGFPLFVRKSKGIVLTKEGAFFYPQAVKLLRHFEMVTREAQRIPQMNRHLRIAVGATNASCIFSPLYKRFQEECETGTVSVIEGSGEQLKGFLDDELADFVIIPRERLTDQWIRGKKAVRLEDIPVLYCVNRDHPLADKQSVAYREIAAYPLVVWNKHADLAAEIENDCAENGIEFQFFCRPSQLTTIISMVRYNIAAAFLPLPLLEGHAEIKGILCRNVPAMHPVVVWTNKDIMGQKRRFQDFLLRHYKRIDTGDL